MTASKIVKNTTVPLQQLSETIIETEAKKKILLNKLEIVKAKARLIQEQLDLLEANLGHYQRPHTEALHN